MACGRCCGEPNARNPYQNMPQCVLERQHVDFLTILAIRFEIRRQTLSLNCKNDTNSMEPFTSDSERSQVSLWNFMPTMVELAACSLELAACQLP